MPVPTLRLRLAELAQRVGAQFHGDADCVIDGVDILPLAGKGKISFLSNRKYRKYLAQTQASAVILSADDLSHCRTNALVADNPYLTYARVVAVLYPEPPTVPGVDPTAVVDPSALIAPGARVGAHAVVEADAVIGERVVVGPNCVVGSGVRIGAESRLVASVTLCHGVQVGERCLFHPGAVIGSDGFGLAEHQGRWTKVPQIGGVRIGNEVEVGANTSIDRGAIRDTVIADGVKLDNQIQIAHNVEIGAHTAIAGCTGISGSTKIGAHCTLAGAVGVVGHIELADHVHISGMSMVSRSIREPGVYVGSIPAMPHEDWRKNFARLRQLDEMARRIKTLEKKLAELDNNTDQ